MIGTAVILCGGQGTRLRPITYEIPKPMMPVQGRPILEHLIELCKLNGIENIILSIGYLKERIKAHFEKHGSALGVAVSYVEEDSPLGTAGPIKLLVEHGKLNKPFVVSNGDELKDINIVEMFKIHKANSADATIALTKVEDPSAYGVAKLDGSKILEFVEKPKKEEAPSNLINSGFYILNPSVAELIPAGFSMLEKDVFPKLASQGKLFGFPFSGQWFDTGTFERYERALKEWQGLTKPLVSEV